MDRLQEQYEKIKGNSMVPGKKIKEVICHGSGDSESIYIRNAEEACDIELEYRNIYKKNKDLIRKARGYINSLPDETLRMVLESVYIKLLPKYKVAAAAGITEQECNKILIVHFNNVF